MVIQRCLKVFASSPGDVTEEWALTDPALRRLADQHRGSLDIRVIMRKHEPLFARTDCRLTTEHPSQCDLVNNILCAQLAQRLPADYAPERGTAAPMDEEFEAEEAVAAEK